jgi:hypothetical protein
MADAEIATWSCRPDERRVLARLRSATGSRSSIRSPRRWKTGAVDVRVTLEVWPDMIRAWHLFYQQVAARRHAAGVGAFMRSMPG